MKIIATIYTAILLTGTALQVQAAGPVGANGDNTGITTQTAIHDQNSRIAALESALVTLQEAVNSQSATITELQSQLSSINNSHVMALEPYLTVDTISDTRGPLVILSGLNLQLINGHGETDSVNGLGNLIIGYDTARSDSTYFCSDGRWTDLTNCESHGAIWSVSHKSGSHYLVIGDQNNYSQYGGIVTGYRNSSIRTYASVSGGNNNTSSGQYSSISGGQRNTANGRFASITGGSNNTTTSRSISASISGGSANIGDGKFLSVCGGSGNTASGIYASVSGGNDNTASGPYSSVSGGRGRSATEAYNWAAGIYSSDN